MLARRWGCRLLRLLLLLLLLRLDSEFGLDPPVPRMWRVDATRRTWEEKNRMLCRIRSSVWVLVHSM